MATQTSYQVSGPAPQFQGYYDQFLPAVFNYANQPYQQYQGQRVAPMSNIQYQALSGIQNQMQGSPLAQQTQGLLGGLMQSGGNPFMQQMIGDITSQARRAYDDATSQLGDRFRNPNSFGGSRHAMYQDRANEAFARGLGGALGNLQYGAYGEGIDRQMRAAQQAQDFEGQRFSRLMQGLQAGNIPRAIRQQQLDTSFQDYQQAQRHPREMIDLINSILSGTRSNQTTTSQPGPNQTAQILGGSALALPALLGLFDFLGK